MQTQESVQFDTKVQNLLERFFKNKLTAKAFLIRIAILMGLGFVLTGVLTSLVTANITNALSSNAFFYILSPLLGLFTIASVIISLSLIIRRVKDIIPDTDVWPYALCAVILGLVPFLNYLLYTLLAFLPSNYLTQEKRSQLLSKFA